MTQSATTASEATTRRWLARHLIVDGTDYGLSVATISHKESGWKITVNKFDREIHSTSYHSGTIKITTPKSSKTAPLIEFI